MDLWLALYWGSPIGLGVFFAGLFGGLGILIAGAAYAEAHRKPK